MTRLTDQNGTASPQDWQPFERVHDLSHRLVGWASETGTPGEAAFPGRLAGLLAEIPYFRDHPDDIALVPSHGDPLTCNVVAVVRGQGDRAVALAGHFDTVATDNYQDLQPLACAPGALAEALIADLSGRTRSVQEDQALADLRSGDFIPGRGMLDMKSGLAVAIALLERFAARSDRQGNLILMATPDEERESRGMRSLRDTLPGLMNRWGLEIAAGINLDVTSDQGDGDLGRSIFAGTIGKLLPFALVIGQPSHASYPFEGMSAQLIGAGILARIEANADLADAGADDVSPPPICLEARDLRDGYEVTTPARYWLSFNWLHHSFTASDLFDRFRTEVAAATEAAVQGFAAQARRFADLAGVRPGAGTAAPRVLTLAELKLEAARRAPPATLAAIAQLENELAGLDNPLELSRRLTLALADAARITGPAVIVGFAGLHYPPTRLDASRSRDAALRHAIEAGRAAMAGEPLAATTWRPYFQGISDMSFFGQTAARGNDALVADNTPAARLIDRPGDDALAYPVVNIGPWGREFHQRLERVQAPYAFDLLPRFLAVVTDALLSGDDPA